ncbi:MAG: hypothetical protein KKG33_13785 [candidate division Zixibacteria bacterium]|nr:hypothetical protein [candidate division Zixibacteria bacterium]
MNRLRFRSPNTKQVRFRLEAVSGAISRGKARFAIVRLYLPQKIQSAVGG